MKFDYHERNLKLGRVVSVLIIVSLGRKNLNITEKVVVAIIF